MRRQSRTFAFKIIFATLFDSDVDLVKDNLFPQEKLDDKDKDFSGQLVSAFLEHKEEIKSKLSVILEGYEIERVYKVDLALIYLAIAEIVFIRTPKTVVINEVIELAKEFSTDKSQKFINGVLAKIE